MLNPNRSFFLSEAPILLLSPCDVIELFHHKFSRITEGEEHWLPWTFEGEPFSDLRCSQFISRVSLML